MPTRPDETMQAIRRYNRKVKAAVTTAYTPDLALGMVHELTVAGSLTIAAPINIPAQLKSGEAANLLRFIIIQDATGGRTVAWNAIYKNAWANTGNTAGKISVISYLPVGASFAQSGVQGPYV